MICEVANFAENIHYKIYFNPIEVNLTAKN